LRGETLRVLRAVPWDRWASAREIAEKVGFSARKVGLIIRHRLSHLVETRRSRPGWRGPRNLYKRRR